MSSVKETLDTFRKAFGPPREGFEEFVKSCKVLDPLMTPNNAPDLCKGYILPNGMAAHDIMMQPYHDSRAMIARPDDVIVASYPKTGTTWTQEICYLIMHDVGLEKANSSSLEERIPFMEIPAIGIKGIENLPSPRLIKTHLPYESIPESFLKNRTKIVYITRNFKDTAVSFYNFMKMVGFFVYSGTLENFLDEMLKGSLIYGTYHDHILNYWRQRNNGHVLFLTYEGLQQDFHGGIRQIAEFLGKTLTDEQVDKIAGHCNFESMSKNPMTNYSHGGASIKAPNSDGSFMRKGKVGDWRNHFTPEMSRKVDEYIEKHFKGSGLEFVYEL